MHLLALLLYLLQRHAFQVISKNAEGKIIVFI